ncbi:MAG: hypothetical protein WBC82_12125 [Dehalococcoidia bacterium]
MKKMAKNIGPNSEQLSPIEKRGACLYAQDVILTDHILKELFSVFEKGEWEKSKKLSQKEATKVMKEVVNYIYFETVKQIWEYQEGGLPENDARKVLDAVSSLFYEGHHIDNLREKLEEYRSVENPIYSVSRNILRIVRGKDIDIAELSEISIIILDITIHYLFTGIRRMFEVSEEEMNGLIENFFVNYYPNLQSCLQKE